MSYKIASCTLRGVSPYSQSQPFASGKEEGETNDAFEKRCWKERLHVSKDGYVEIPAMSLPNAIKQAAKYANIKIPGQRNSTYTKHFESGIMMVAPVKLDIKADDIDGEWLFVPSDGVPGGGKRVYKKFPLIPSWDCAVDIYILDPVINEEIFSRIIKVAGTLIGIGRFRPKNRGYYGRFAVDEIKWREEDV